MDNRQETSRASVDSLALAMARKHVRALTEGGVSPQALLRALLEQEEANNEVAPLPSQPVHQPQLKKSKSLSRTLSLSQAKSQSSHWSVSTAGKPVLAIPFALLKSCLGPVRYSSMVG